MTSTRKLITKLAVAIGLMGTLMFSAATPSLAASAANTGSHYYEPGDNGSVWSYYPGYTDDRAQATPTRHVPSAAYGAFAQVPGARQHGNAAVDDPPGSLFQDRANNASMGCPC
jgi:hypothetical protein